MTDRGLKRKRHRMTPIEHFLIEITIADIGNCKVAIDIFQPTLRNFLTDADR